MKTLALSSLALGLFACTVGSGEPLRGDEPNLSLSDSELATELRTSPMHRSDKSFTRVGVMVDADTADSIEIATSSDGANWSAWKSVRVRHVEANARSSFNGELILDAPAMYFKLRGNASAASFLRLDTLDGDQNFDWEVSDEEEGDEATAFAGQASFAGNGFTFRTRAQWGAKSGSCTSALTGVNKITIHHTDTPANNPEARVRSIQQYHRVNRRWCDIAYHFLVDEAGVVYEGRPISKLGAHAGGANTGNIGIALIGSYERAEPSAAQMKSVALLAGELADRYGITLSRSTLKGHREVGTTSTDCPGAKVFSKLAQVVTAARNGGNGAGGGSGSGGGGETGGGGGGGGSPSEVVTVTGFIYEGMNPSKRVAGALVAIGSKTATTRSDGTFSIAGVEERIQTVSVTKNGFVTASVSRNLGSSTWVSVGVTATPAAGGGGTGGGTGGGGTATPAGDASLQGVVYVAGDSTDRIPFASVTLSNGRTITADANGFYILHDMAAGSVTITASKAGYTTASVSRTLVNGSTTWGSVPLR